MDLTQDFSNTQQAIQASLVATTRVVSNIAAQDTGFHRSLSPAVATSLDDKSRRLLRLTERLLQRSGATSSSKLSLPNVDAVDSKWQSLVDAADNLFERANTCLDEYSGFIQKAHESDSPNKPSPASTPTRERLDSALRRPDLPKPQLLFDTPTFNHETSAFRPLLTSKPHSKTPLKRSLRQVENKGDAPRYQHPYEDEIMAYSYPAFVHARASSQDPSSFEATGATFVDTEEKLGGMLAELKLAREVAIDLEHHDYHSYVGLVSLMQISTRDRDWVVDTLKPWRRKLEMLNEVFADPSILKVFHGAHMDVVWLQRDLGLYLVGLFDTHHAARVLGYTGKSLAFLLKKFVKFDAQKQYQTADWRIRPLPSELLDYARSDTHFLLYIYDCMRNELLGKTAMKVAEGEERDCIDDVLQLSKEYCLQRYEHPVYNDHISGRGGWAAALTRHGGQMSQEQIAAFAKIHHWRDSTARIEDESVQYVMPNHVLINIARALPADKPSLLAVSNPISPFVRWRTDALVEFIKEAKTEASKWPDMVTVIRAQQGGAYGMTTALQPGNVDSEPSNHLHTQINSQPLASSLTARESRLWGAMSHTPSLEVQQQVQYKILMASPDWAQIPTAGEAFKEFAIETEKSPKNARFNINGSTPTPTEPIPILGKRNAPVADDLAEPISGSEDENRMMPARMKSAKAERRTERKMKKRAEKAAAVAQSNGLHMDHNAPITAQQPAHEMFDESPSLQMSKDKRRKKEVKPIPSPYARAEQAAPGLKRARMQGAGRSATFKS